LFEVINHDSKLSHCITLHLQKIKINAVLLNLLITYLSKNPGEINIKNRKKFPDTKPLNVSVNVLKKTLNILLLWALQIQSWRASVFPEFNKHPKQANHTAHPSVKTSPSRVCVHWTQHI